MPDPTYVYIALLDVLAYRIRLQADRNSGELAFKDDLIQAMTVFSSVNETDFPYQAISDTIIVTCPQRDHFPELLSLLKDVYASFLDHNLLVRGGVAYSQHFKSSHVTYSHALALAHELESKKAVFPRIVIDANIIAMLDQLKPDAPYKKLLAENNGIHFLNVADADNWERLYQSAMRIYRRDAAALRGDEAAFQKHVWLQNFLLQHPSRRTDASPYVDPIRYLE